MRIRTLALALVLGCGLTAMAEAKQPKQKTAVHHPVRKAPKARKSNSMKPRKTKRPNTSKAQKAARTAKTRHKNQA